MDEDVGPLILADEAPALRIVEPLDGTDCHHPSDAVWLEEE
jgi:hypothetical protein